MRVTLMRLAGECGRGSGMFRVWSHGTPGLSRGTFDSNNDGPNMASESGDAVPLVRGRAPGVARHVSLRYSLATWNREVSRWATLESWALGRRAWPGAKCA